MRRGDDLQYCLHRRRRYSVLKLGHTATWIEAIAAVAVIVAIIIFL